MAGFWHYIVDILAPPGVRKKHRGGVFKTVARVADKINKDIATTQRRWFSFLTQNLNEQGDAWQIPRFPFDTDQAYRLRLVSAAAFLDTTGEKAHIAFFLNNYIPDRWVIVDYPNEGFRVNYSRVNEAFIGADPKLIIYVLEGTSEELSNIKSFLEWTLAADIGFFVEARSSLDLSI